NELQPIELHRTIEHHVELCNARDRLAQAARLRSPSRSRAHRAPAERCAGLRIGMQLEARVTARLHPQLNRIDTGVRIVDVLEIHIAGAADGYRLSQGTVTAVLLGGPGLAVIVFRFDFDEGIATGQRALQADEDERPCLPV